MSYPDNFAECRATFHPWEARGLHRNDGPNVVWRWVEEWDCPQCHTKKYVATDVRGVSHNRYVYPAGYRLGFKEMPSKREFKLMRLEKRWKEGHDEARELESGERGEGAVEEAAR